MADHSRIQWTEATWNPVTGCSRTSPGCARCYALTLAARLKKMGQPKYQADGDPPLSGPGFGVTLHADALDEPLRWRKPRTVFVCSMSDLFHHQVPDDFIARVFAVMAAAPQHTFQVLTKRSQRMAEVLVGWNESLTDPLSPLYKALKVVQRPGRLPIVWPLPNVWLGVSIESARYAFRAGHLRSAPAAVRFLSLEPLLGPMSSLDLSGIDWCIVGGESGFGARTLDLAWVREVRDRCAAAGTALFVKQLGAAWARANLLPDRHGGTIHTFPADLRVREMPGGARV